MKLIFSDLTDTSLSSNNILMPKKIIIAIIFFFLAVPVYFQVARVNAEDQPLTGPLTPPITSEVTPTPSTGSGPTATPTATVTPTTTVTPTITVTTTPTVTPTPHKKGTLSGHVSSRRVWNFDRHHGKSKEVDVEGVTITVKKFFGGGIVATDTTDEDGNYRVDLPTGLYRVEASESGIGFFVPPFKVVHIERRDHKKADFQAVAFWNH